MGSGAARRVATVDRLRRQWLDRPAPARRVRRHHGGGRNERTTAPRGLAIGVTAVAVFCAAVWAAQPDKAPFTPDPIVLEPGQACAFPVEIAPVTGNLTDQRHHVDWGGQAIELCGLVD